MFGKSNFLVIFLASLESFQISNCYVIDYSTISGPGDANENLGDKISVEENTENGEKLLYITTEYPTFLEDPTKLQEDVLSELEAIWDYTERLSDPGLKTSLKSLVQFTYARIQSEPEDSLDRLKYLLAKLRARLSGSDADPPKEPGIRKRSFRTNYHEEEVDMLTSNILEQLKNSLDIYNSFPTENQLISSVNHVFSQNYPVAEPVVLDTLESKISAFEGQIPTSTPTVQIRSEESTVRSNETIEQSVLHKPSCSNLTFPFNAEMVNNSTDDKEALRSNATHSEDSICYTNKTDAVDSQGLQNFTDTQDLDPEILKMDANDNSIPQNLPSYLDDLLTRVVDTHEQELVLLDNVYSDSTSTAVPEASISLENSTTNSTDGDPLFDDYDLIFDYEFATDPEGYLEEEESEPLILNFLDGLTAPSEVDPIFAAASMINGTRDGLIRFVQGFTRLKKYVKIIIVFIISVGMIGAGMLLYKLLPPLLFAAILSALLPLLLLLLLDNGIIGGRKISRREALHSDRRKMQRFKYKGNPRVLTLISDATEKYKN